MTSKQRIMKAFANSGEPDRVPVEPGLDWDTLTNLSGLDYWEYAREGNTELSGLISYADKLGFDLYHYAAGIPVANPSGDVDVQIKTVEQGDDLRIVETNVTTSAGTIQELLRKPKYNPEYAHKKFVKDIQRDWPVFKQYFGTDWPVDPRYFDEYKKVGDRGVVGFVVHSPIDWWQECRHGGIQQVLFDFFDEEKMMEEIFEYYRVESFKYLKAVTQLNPKPDFVMVHGSSCSASVSSPDLFKKYVLPYVQQAAALLKDAGVLSMFHVCGKSNEWVGMLADTDLNVIDALEQEGKGGNVNLAEVKKLYGDKLCLKGNISAITMANGSVEQVRDEVKEAIDAAAEGGGFMLAVGDSIGPKGNLANIEAMIETALEYGKY
ncbi:uroporphyrinogen decarboxylase family protein [Planctomycetota bacterium]